MTKDSRLVTEVQIKEGRFFSCAVINLRLCFVEVPVALLAHVLAIRWTVATVGTTRRRSQWLGLHSRSPSRRRAATSRLSADAYSKVTLCTSSDTN